MATLKWHCGFCAWIAIRTYLELPFPIYQEHTLAMEPPSETIREQIIRSPSPEGWTQQRYAPRRPIQPLYGLSCCLLQYLQCLDASEEFQHGPNSFFSKLNYPNPVRAAVYRTWSPDIDRACGFVTLSNLASIHIIITTQKHFELTVYGIRPHYTFVAEASLRDKRGRTLWENGAKMKVAVKHVVVVMGEKQERWDRMTYAQVVNTLRRAGKCKFTRFGESRDDEEVLRIAKTLPSPVEDTKLVDTPVFD